MKVWLCVLLTTTIVLGDDAENRRTKLPYVADAVGNTLPPPSNLPAVVGSPVNLLTPDRYEFYTFDESGELIKRLMTLEEIQAIVAAGEETEGLVTFANDNHPTIALNFSQPPYTKVHNVVTNVQNVLKAQMEVHKNKPHIQPTLDTPDVSDSWSLILPSIFNNTGVDIIPDKTSGTFTTPDTETIDLEHAVDDNSLSKEGSNQILSSSSTIADEELKQILVTEKISTTVNPTSTTTTTTLKPTTTTTTTTTATKPTTTTTIKPLSTTSKPTTIKPTTSKRITTIGTTNKPRVTALTTTRPRTTTITNQPRTTTTTVKPTTQQNVRTTPKVTTSKPNITTKKQTTSTQDHREGNFTRIQFHTVANTISTTDKTTVKYEKISTFIPISSAAFVIERSTQEPEHTTKPDAVHASTTKRAVTTTIEPSTRATTKTQPAITTYKPSISTSPYFSTTERDTELDKFNATTVTTQSVAPSTTESSTEFVLIGQNSDINKNNHEVETSNNTKKESEPDYQLFDVAQSFSQIASDLGNDRPLPTTSELLETTKFNDMNLESKENIEIDIPPDVEKTNENKSSIFTEKNPDFFVKISTLDPHGQNNSKQNANTGIKETSSKNENAVTIETINKKEITTDLPLSSTIDPVLSESMDDLLSQVVNQAPQPILNIDKNSNSLVKTTENLTETTTIENSLKLKETLETDLKIDQKTTSKPSELILKQNNNTESIQIKESNISKYIDQQHAKLNSMKTDKVAAHNQSYVQISISNNITLSQIESAPTASPTKPIKKENETIVDTQNLNFSEKYIQPFVILHNQDKNTNISSKNESSYTKEQFKDESSPINKVESVSVQNNKKIHKDKISEPLPKIDEFKKKIQKVNIDEKELINERNSSWKLISTVIPPKINETQKDKLKNGQDGTSNKDIILEFSKENQGLEITTSDLGEDVAQFTELCNELAFRYWHAMIDNIDKKRSFVLSPYSITSMLAMIFMGARGATSGEMNEILKLDDMVTFNPHFTLKNISDSLEMTPVSGVIVSAFVRELFSDRNKGKILTFYKERAQHFYNGHVEEVNFKLISDIIRRRTNLLVKRNTWGKVIEYMKANSIIMQPPLAAFSVNIFQTDCSDSSVEGRDGEMYFVVSPNVRQRRLVPVPAVVYKDSFLAGYDPVLDVTAASLGNSIISTLFVMPGQQGNIVHAEDLEALEKRLLESIPITSAWKRLLRTLLPRMGLELQIPRFSHKSIFNVSSTLREMGLKDLFDEEKADLGGLIGPSKDLYVSDMIQSTTFVTCGGGVIGEQHHIEEYPEKLVEPQRRRTSRWAAGWDEPRDYQRAFHDPHDVGEAMYLPLHLRPRQARLPSRNAQPARLKFDRPFLYFVRHNPTGMILYVGRYNPRLLP